jgi:hypothetical protein
MGQGKVKHKKKKTLALGGGEATTVQVTKLSVEKLEQVKA